MIYKTDLSEELVKLLLDDMTVNTFGYSIYSLSKGSLKPIYHTCTKCNKPKLNSVRNFINNLGLSHRRCVTKIEDIINKKYLNLLLKEETINKYEKNHIYSSNDYVFIKCEICNKPKEIMISNLNSGKSLVHNKSCKIDKIKKTNLKRYGSESPLSSNIVCAKIKETNLKIYGSENPSSSLYVRNKVKETNLERYGVDNPMQNKEIKEKFKKSFIEKYGVDNPLKDKDILEKVQNTNLEKYGVVTALELESTKDKRKDLFFNRDIYFKHENLSKDIWLKMIFWGDCKINPNQELPEKWSGGSHIIVEIICSCGKIFKPVFKDFISGKHYSCGHNYGTSYSEQEIFKFIKENTKDAINRYKENGVEFDIYIPSKRICVEYNGLIWHGEKFAKDFKKDYKKYLYCKKNNIRYIGIFEDEWINEKDRIKNYLTYLLENKQKYKVRPQKLEIKYKKSSNKDIKSFLSKYHYLSEKTSLKHIWTCYYNNKLIAVFGIGKPTRQNIKEEWELKRVCLHPDYKCYGLWSYLLKRHVQPLLSPCTITSFSDNRRDTGNLYKKLNFIKIKETKPDYWWCDSHNKRFHKSKLRKTKEERLTDKTEVELRHEQGYYRIWDCGKTKWNFILI